MKKLLLLVLFMTSGHAMNIIKLPDGRKGFCQNKRDVFRSELSKVVSLSRPRIHKIDNEFLYVKLDVNFYKCRQVGTKFKFIKTGFNKTEKYEFEGREVLTSYRNPVIRAISSDNDLLASSELNEYSKSVTLKVDLFELDTTTLSEDGEMYFDLDLSLERAYLSHLYFSGWEQKIYGDFRVFINFDELFKARSHRKSE